MLRSLSEPLDRLARRERSPRIDLTSPIVWLPVARGPHRAIAGVNMPQHDRWMTEHNLCRVMGDPNLDVGVVEYEAAAAHC